MQWGGEDHTATAARHCYVRPAVPLLRLLFINPSCPHLLWVKHLPAACREDVPVALEPVLVDNLQHTPGNTCIDSTWFSRGARQITGKRLRRL